MSNYGKIYPIESIYIHKFDHASYVYEKRYKALIHKQSRQHSSRSLWQMSILDIDLFSRRFKLKEVRQRRGNAISYESSRLSLPVGASVILELSETDTADQGALYLSANNELQRSYSEVMMVDVPHLMNDFFSSLELDQFEHVPRVSTSYRARLMRGKDATNKDLWCVIEDEVKYIDSQFNVLLAEEKHHRVYWLTTPSEISHIDMLPLSSRYWMGEYHYKRLHRLPCWNELEGYEYEAKLAPLQLWINEDRLPYQVIERYQTESIRWYLPKSKGRVGFRDGRASIVKKGKKVELGYIIKRAEDKSQGLSTWALAEDLFTSQSPSEPILGNEVLQMRRIKRQLYLHNPETDRVYALCLDYCYVEGRAPLLQIEIEYNGRLCLPLNELKNDRWMTAARQYELARSLISDHPKTAMRCCERIAILDHGLQTKEVVFRAQKVEQLKKDLQDQIGIGMVTKDQEPTKDIEADQPLNTAQLLVSIKEGKKNKKSREKVSQGELIQSLSPLEKTVLDEMTLLVNALIDHQGCKPSKLTKKRWLKDLLNTL